MSDSIILAAHAALTSTEQTLLTELERTIDHGLRAFMAAGQALETIRIERLYRATHSSFEAYCADRWQISDSHANRLIEASRTVRLLESTPIGVVPTSESVARPLTTLDDDQQQVEAWDTAVSVADGKPTAKQVEAVVKTFKSDVEAEIARHGWTWHGNERDGYMIQLDAETVTAVVPTLRLALMKAYQLQADHVRSAVTEQRQQILHTMASQLPSLPPELTEEWEIKVSLSFDGEVSYYGLRKASAGAIANTPNYRTVDELITALTPPSIPNDLMATGWELVRSWRATWWYMQHGNDRTNEYTSLDVDRMIKQARALQREQTRPQHEPVTVALPQKLVDAGWKLNKNERGYWCEHPETGMQTGNVRLPEHAISQAEDLEPHRKNRPTIPQYLLDAGWQLSTYSKGLTGTPHYRLQLYKTTKETTSGKSVVKEAEQLHRELKAAVLGSAISATILGWQPDSLRNFLAAIYDAAEHRLNDMQSTLLDELIKSLEQL